MIYGVRCVGWSWRIFTRRNLRGETVETVTRLQVEQDG